MKIVIEDHNPEWKAWFASEKNLLTKIFAGISITVEHIGSTSVEGLGAKPVIDIMLGLEDFSLADGLVSKIEKLGYAYISKYENEMPYRRFFTKEINGKRTHHIHMVELKSEFWKRHLFFRDHLRANDTAREQYHQLKVELAKREWSSGDEYADAKGEFIKSIEKLAVSREG